MRGCAEDRYEQDLPSKFRTDGHLHHQLGKDGARLGEDTKGRKELCQLKEDYHRRREEMRTLAFEYDMGGATIDPDMRLAPVPPGNRDHIHDRGIFGFDAGDHGNNNERGAEGEEGRVDDDGFGMNDDNNNLNDQLIPDVPDMLPAIFGLPMHGEMDEEEMMQRNIERKESEAAEIIRLAVERYRREGVSEEEFEVILVPPHYDDYISLTLRRICFAVFFVIGAFTCLMLQTIPLMDSVKDPDPVFDKLLHELLHVRSFGQHVKDCGGLKRDEAEGELDCASGVLHIPPTTILNTLNKTKDFTPIQQEAYMAYRNGVNISWSHPCVMKDLPPSNCAWKQEYKEEIDETCDAQSPLSCFRGVHDGIINDEEVDGVLKLSALLVKQGGDHMEIHNDVEPLIVSVPSVTEKLQSILRSDYALPPIRPVAFRISVSLPADSPGAAMHHSTHQTELLKQAVNKTAFLKWEKHFEERYQWSGISLPPLIKSPPFRDPCILMADLEANSTFAFHSSVFLSGGAGENFSGGVSLYADSHLSNSDPRNKIHRGVSIDGSRGRVVVSSGGHDNLRCKFPTRTGIRAVLQVWWDCDV